MLTANYLLDLKKVIELQGPELNRLDFLNFTFVYQMLLIFHFHFDLALVSTLAFNAASSSSSSVCGSLAAAYYFFDDPPSIFSIAWSRSSEASLNFIADANTTSRSIY